MANEKINRLLKYDVEFPNYVDAATESFTGDSYSWDPASQSLKFYRTGNLIREYFGRPHRVVATPVDDEG